MGCSTSSTIKTVQNKEIDVYIQSRLANFGKFI